MVIYHRNRAFDRWKASLNGHHDWLPIPIIKQYLPHFEIANQVYDKNIAQVIRYMEMNSNNLAS